MASFGARREFAAAAGRRPHRSATGRAGATHFLVNKYYLDHLYEKVIVHGIAHPIAEAAYWINQHVLDGIVNGAGQAGTAHW